MDTPLVSPTSFREKTSSGVAQCLGVVITYPGLNFNPSFFFFLSKALSRIIFSILFRVSNHQIVGKENFKKQIWFTNESLLFKPSYLSSIPH